MAVKYKGLTIKQMREKLSYIMMHTEHLSRVEVRNRYNQYYGNRS